MNWHTYSVEKDGIFKIVNSTNDPVGVCRALFGLTGRYIPWREVDSFVTIVNGNITVRRWKL